MDGAFYLSRITRAITNSSRLTPGDEYPFIGDRLISNRGLDIAVRDYDSHFEEHQVPHSNALHSRLKHRGAYLCGPLARFNLHFDKLSAAAREAAQRANIAPQCLNPFKSILVRGVEIAYALEEAIALIQAYDASGEPFVTAPLRHRSATGSARRPAACSTIATGSTKPASSATPR